jgi:protein-glutamine gamma-glutamyltransferase
MPEPEQVIESPLSRTLGRYLDISLYLLVLTGFAILASTESLGLFNLAFAAAALVVRGYFLYTNNAFAISVRTANWLTVGYAAFYLADYFFISGTFLSATVHLVLFVTVLRMFSLRRDRDRYFLAIISFLMVLASAILTVNSVFLGLFALFMLTAVGTFILMEMKSAAGKAAATDRSEVPGHQQIARSLAKITPVLVVCILLAGTMVFFLLPRVSAGYLSAYSPINQYSTGFSDRVELGAIGEIQRSSAVVMHIQIDGDRNIASTLKWRGVALSTFDGRSWSNSHRRFPATRLADGSFALWPAGRAPDPSNSRRIVPLHYRVLMEPIGTNVFFLAPFGNRIQGNYRNIATSADGNGEAFNMDGEHPIAAYDAWSDISRPAADDLRGAAENQDQQIALRYLQLPRTDPRIPALARKITASEANNYDKAAAIEHYLQSQFGYTLQLPSSEVADPLANFLFERKQGHCEYFASAMAVMLRTLRIPSRVVTGFRGGEYNDLSGQFVVRASEAHAWVEAYFPNYGWVSFDPTPSVPAVAPVGWRRIALYLDAFQSFWREWIVNYDVSHQYALGHDVLQRGQRTNFHLQIWARGRYQNLLRGAKRIWRAGAVAPKRWAMKGLLVLFGLVLLFSSGRILRWTQLRSIAAHPANAPELASSIWYERMTRLLSRRGWKKTTTQTPQEFVRSIPDDSVREQVSRFTQQYESARFGGSVEAAEQLPEIYEEISSK